MVGADTVIQPTGGKWQSAGLADGPSGCIAWRTIDAQFWGVPQRRRRIFAIVGHPGDFSVAKILFEPEGLRWNTQASRETGQEIARAVGEGTGAAGFNFEMWSGECIEASPALQARRAKDNLVYENHPNDSRVKKPLDVCEQLTARNGTGGGNLPLVQEAGKYWNGEDVASTQDASMLAKQQMMPDKNRFNCVIEPIPIHDQATRHSGKRGSNQDGKGNGLGVGKPGECRTTLTKGDKHAVAFNWQPQMQVRRLTPVECERLQNFPDNWTRIPWRGKSPEQCPDGPRYKAIGNSMAVCVVEFIAERIAHQLQER
jgi:DNA (cytosine-5)-methyltransferase 1